MFKILKKTKIKTKKNTDNNKPHFARIFYINKFGVGHCCLAERIDKKKWICYDLDKQPFDTITENADSFRIIKEIQGSIEAIDEKEMRVIPAEAFSDYISKRNF